MAKQSRRKLKEIQKLMTVLSAIAKRKMEQEQRKTIMFILQKFMVRKNERGMLFREGDFMHFLEPGSYLFFDPLRKNRVEVYDLSVPKFSHRLADFLLKEFSEEVARYFTMVELGPQQVALIHQNGRMTNILPPSTRTLYWKGIVDITTEIIDISNDFEIPYAKAAQWLHVYQNQALSQQAAEFLYSKTVPEHQLGLLYVDGQYTRTLKPGSYAYWQFNRKLNIEIWDMRLQSLEVAGQEILSKDKVSLRINLAASYLIKDVLQVISTIARPTDHLYKELQFGLRAAVGTRTLDELLENKNVIDESVFAYIRDKTADLGIEVQNIGVKDIILPGEMKTILSKVVEAEKVAQANLIKRREETAATRSLLNTAKVMENSPTALRLKELEILEKVSEKIGNISVYSGLEGLLKKLIKLK